MINYNELDKLPILAPVIMHESGFFFEKKKGSLRLEHIVHNARKCAREGSLNNLDMVFPPDPPGEYVIYLSPFIGWCYMDRESFEAYEKEEPFYYVSIDGTLSAP